MIGRTPKCDDVGANYSIGASSSNTCLGSIRKFTVLARRSIHRAGHEYDAFH